ncbi:hypothetical protein M427DRAFT_158141 [Gonapodya prolifera JEL478]|uniref:Uncharacterized protein n=1 Tax=Gonapodya prolifera (strain JEL478) TaxID=1344416 RepID=A0A139A4E1_GONPJ|nr:hypothetical protein M427DRAFT_158141 [Gonapodya prolifera JEL478]|eukprot:KXS11584.1 hypothetical protein M427DRAFT_158141 [Gonapodya prolifera JEL478]
MPGLTRIHVRWWGGEKTVVIRPERLPATFNEFVYFLCGRIPGLEEGGREKVIRMGWREAKEGDDAESEEGDKKDGRDEKRIDLDDDDDLLNMFESGGDYIDVAVELREPTPRTRHRLISPQFILAMRSHLSSTKQAQAQTPRYDPGTVVGAAPSSHNTFPHSHSIAAHAHTLPHFSSLPHSSSTSLLSHYGIPDSDHVAHHPFPFPTTTSTAATTATLAFDPHPPRISSANALVSPPSTPLLRKGSIPHAAVPGISLDSLPLPPYLPTPTTLPGPTSPTTDHPRTMFPGPPGLPSLKLPSLPRQDTHPHAEEDPTATPTIPPKVGRQRGLSGGSLEHMNMSRAASMPKNISSIAASAAGTPSAQAQAQAQAQAAQTPGPPTATVLARAFSRIGHSGARVPALAHVHGGAGVGRGQAIPTPPTSPTDSLSAFPSFTDTPPHLSLHLSSTPPHLAPPPGSALLQDPTRSLSSIAFRGVESRAVGPSVGTSPGRTAVTDGGPGVDSDTDSARRRRASTSAAVTASQGRSTPPNPSRDTDTTPPPFPSVQRAKSDPYGGLGAPPRGAASPDSSAPGASTSASGAGSPSRMAALASSKSADHLRPRTTATAPPAPPSHRPPSMSTLASLDYFSVTGGQGMAVLQEGPGAAAKRYTFPMEWRNSRADSVESVMGVLGRAGWEGQRSMGYKQADMLDTKGGQLSVTYVPRLSNAKRPVVAGGAGVTLCFTIFFNTRALLNLAMDLYPLKVPDLTPRTFRNAFLIPLFTCGVATEWCCLAPPEDLVKNDPKAPGNYRVVFVVKDERERVSESCGRVVGGWLSNAVGDGVWAEEMLRRSFPGLLTKTVARTGGMVGLDR